MSSFATSSTVQAQGEVHIAGVPFAPGTEVEVTISPKQPAPEAVIAPGDAASRDRMQQLFQTVKGFRNTPRIPREELHDRGSLR